MKNKGKVFTLIIVALAAVTFIVATHGVLVIYEENVTDSVSNGMDFLLYDVVVGVFLIYGIYKWFKWWFTVK
jgi:hypothetical protein